MWTVYGLNGLEQEQERAERRKGKTKEEKVHLSKKTTSHSSINIIMYVGRCTKVILNNKKEIQDLTAVQVYNHIQ